MGEGGGGNNLNLPNRTGKEEGQVSLVNIIEVDPLFLHYEGGVGALLGLKN